MMIQGQWKSDGTIINDTSWTVVPWESHASGEAYNETYNGYGYSMEFQQSCGDGSPVNFYCPFEVDANTSTTPTATNRMSRHYFYQVTITKLDKRSSSISVGLVRPKQFQAGYRIKGMFYNGNLTNGGAALKVNYGPYLKQGDVLLIEYIHDDDDASVQMKIHLNGDYLGLGFQIPKPALGLTESENENPNMPLFVPCMSVRGHAKLDVLISSAMPHQQAITTVNPLVGKWWIERATKEGETEPFWPASIQEENHDTKNGLLSIDCPEQNDVHNGESTAMWSISLHCGNTFTMNRQIEWNNDINNGFYLYELVDDGTGKIVSTRMMARPPWHQLGIQLSDAIANQWKKLLVSANGTELTIQSKQGAVLAKCSRFQQNQDVPACTSY